MTRGLIFWIILLVWAVFFLAVSFGYVGPYGARGSAIIDFILFVLLGWQVYGPPVKGG